MRISDWSSDVCSSDLLAVGVERFERERAPTAAEVVLGRKDRLARLFDQRVPFDALGALPLPALSGGAAVLAYILAFRFGHHCRITGTKMEHQRFPPSSLRGQIGRE